MPFSLRRLTHFQLLVVFPALSHELATISRKVFMIKKSQYYFMLLVVLLINSFLVVRAFGQNAPARPSQRYDRVGSYDWDGDFSGYPNGYPGASAADKVNWVSNLVSSAQGARTIRIKLHTSSFYGLPIGNTLKDTVMQGHYATLFNNSKFNTYLITAYSNAGQNSVWGTRSSTSEPFYTDAEALAERNEFEQLSTYLST